MPVRISELDINMVFSIMLALALEQKHRAASRPQLHVIQGGAQSGEPPPLAVAA